MKRRRRSHQMLSVQVHAVIGVLMDDTDPLVTVMKVEKAPQETYADIGGLDNQIQEIKVSETCTTMLFSPKRSQRSCMDRPLIVYTGIGGVTSHTSRVLRRDGN